MFKFSSCLADTFSVFASAGSMIWSHGKLNRDLDPTIAAALSVEQVRTWIAAGRDREPAL